MSTVDKLAQAIKGAAAKRGIKVQETGDSLILHMVMPNGRPQSVTTTAFPNKAHGQLVAFISYIGPDPGKLSAAHVMGANEEMVWGKIIRHNNQLAVAAFQPPANVAPDEALKIIDEVAAYAEKYQVALGL
jgi:hypothetical protein